MYRRFSRKSAEEQERVNKAHSRQTSRKISSEMLTQKDTVWKIEINNREGGIYQRQDVYCWLWCLFTYDGILHLVSK